MYEGKNIHFSQVDNKPLCSSSRKICRQRRLNGYAFCVRHILEDPGAPFKSCEFITRSKLPCSNPIPKDDSRQYCNSHLQQLAQASSNSKVAKSRDRKQSNAGSKVSAPTTPCSTPSTPTTPPTPPDTPFERGMTLADRLKSKFNMCAPQRENGPGQDEDPDDPYAFPEPQLNTEPPTLNQTARLITPPKTGNKLSGILSKGPPNAIVSRSPPTTGNGVLSTPGSSPTAGHSPVSAPGLSLKIQPGLKQTLGLKESPPPAIDVQQTGLNQNSPGRLAQTPTSETALGINKAEAAILSQVGLSPDPRRAKNSVLTNHVNSVKDKQHSGDLFTKMSSSSGASIPDSSDVSDMRSKSPVKRPGSSTPIAQLYPELAEKLERTRNKPDVKLKGDVKSKSEKKNSRTMNRLQTKIAQNKIKDKLKKSEKVSAPLAMSLPNALTKEVAPNVTITPEMSALQAQLLSALPPRHAGMGDNKFPFASMGNMPLMHKFGPGGDAGINSTVRQFLKQPVQDHRGRLPPPPYPYPSPGGVAPPGLDVTAAAATLAAAAAAAAAKTAASQAGGDGVRSPSHGPPRPGGQTSPAPQYPYTSHMSPHKGAASRDSKCDISSGGAHNAATSSTTSHSMLGLPPPHPAPHLQGQAPPPPHAPHSTKGKHKHRQPRTLSNITTGQPTVRVRLKRRHDVLSEREARCKLKRHSAVKAYAYHASQRMNSKDILPLGVGSSDEDSDMEEELPWQHTWFSVSSDDDNSEDDDEEDLAAYTRTAKLSLLRSRLRRRCKQLKKTQHFNKHCRTFQEKAIRALIVATSQSPSAARDAIRAMRGQLTTAHRAEDASHSERKCKCKKDPSSEACADMGDNTSSTCCSRALPYTNHCVNHIMYNVDQQLFDYCTAKFSDNTQCCVPVFDVRHELPLCPEHAAKADNYNKCDLKPKKPRKKTKPSALTRPPKKGKKKKNQKNKSSVRPQKPIIDEHTARAHTQRAEMSMSVESMDDDVSKSSSLVETSPILPLPTKQQKQPVTIATQQTTTNTPEQTSTTPAVIKGNQFDVKKKSDAQSLPGNRKKKEASGVKSTAEAASGQVDEIMTSSSRSRDDVISPPPDMRELVNDITKSLDTPPLGAPPLGAPAHDTPPGGLDHPLSPGSMVVTSLLPGLDDTEQTKFLDEHDLNEVLNRLPEEAFDIFTSYAGEGKNGGDFRQETEEFERALAEVSRNEKLAGRETYMSETDDGDELTKQIADSILNSSHLDPDGDDQLDVFRPDELNDQNLSELASSISAHDLNSMSQALTVSVLNHALDINTQNNMQNGAGVVRPGGGCGVTMVRPGAPGAVQRAAHHMQKQGVGNGASVAALRAQQQQQLSAGLRPGQHLAQQQQQLAAGARLLQQQLPAGARFAQAQQQALPAGVRPGQPITFPILQGQLLQGHLVAATQGGPVVPITAQPRIPNTTLKNSVNSAQRPVNAVLMQGPPNATVQGTVPSLQTQSTAVSQLRPGVPAPVVPASSAHNSHGAAAPRMPSSGAGGIVQNLLQSPPMVAPPNVHQQHRPRPNILQQTGRVNHAATHGAQSFQIQGPNIQAQRPSGPRTPTRGQGQTKGRGQACGVNQRAEDQISAIQAQLAQGPGVGPQNRLQIQLPSALAALGGAGFSVSPQGALVATSTAVGRGVGKGQPPQQLPGLFTSPSAGPPSLIPSPSSPALTPTGQINGNLMNATEQLKQLVSQSPVAIATNAFTTNNKKRGSRSRRTNPAANNKQTVHACTVSNHVTSTANQSQQTTTTTLPLLTANQIRADGGLKLALPLQALLPSDVSAVLTTVNGTTQEVSKATASTITPTKRSRSNSARKQKTQTNP